MSLSFFVALVEYTPTAIYHMYGIAHINGFISVEQNTNILCNQIFGSESKLTGNFK